MFPSKKRKTGKLRRYKLDKEKNYSRRKRKKKLGLSDLQLIMGDMLSKLIQKEFLE